MISKNIEKNPSSEYIIRIEWDMKEIAKALGIILFAALIFSAFLFYQKDSTPISYAACPDGCYPHAVCGCTGYNGCGGPSCDTCDRGPCGGCTPDPCSTYYTETNTGCSQSNKACTRTYCTGDSCGQYYRTCYLVKYTLTYSAGTGGYISGTTPQGVCRGSNGTQVTAVPNSGYHFVNWSDSVSTASRTDTSVVADKSVTANFAVSNQAPTAPTDLRTDNNINPSGITGYPKFKAIFNDPDVGNTGVHYRIQVNTTSAFNGTNYWYSAQTAMSATARGSYSPEITYAGTTLPLNGSTFYWRIQFWDNYGAQGAWSTGTNTFTMNTPPSSPTELQTNSATNPVGITTPPQFRAKFQDPNSGNTGTKYEIEVNTNSAFTGTMMWQSGLQSMTTTAIGAYSPQITYAGSTLTENGATYYWRIRFADNYGTVGSWSTGTNTFTMNTPPSSPTELQTNSAANPIGLVASPQLRAKFQDPNSGNTGTKYEIHVNTNSSFTGTSMWQSGLQNMTSTAIGVYSPQITYAGTALPLTGVTYYWRIRFADNYGTVGSWSPAAQFTMNTAPLAPSSMYTEGTTNPKNVTDLTPEFSAVFQDSDTGNSGVHYEIHVNTNSSFTGTSMWQSGKTAITPIAIGARSSDISYAGTALSTNGTTYYWRMKFWDNLGSESAWSSTAQFTMQGAPLAPTDLLTDGSTNPQFLITLTPTLSAVYNDPNGHNASAYEINVNTNSSFTGTVMWNSGKVNTTVSEGSRSPNYTYNGTALLPDSTTYYWRIRFWDVDNLQGAWSATNSFVSNLNRQYFKGLQLKGLQLR